jgi:hypothetical protein
MGGSVSKINKTAKFDPGPWEAERADEDCLVGGGGHYWDIRSKTTGDLVVGGDGACGEARK